MKSYERHITQRGENTSVFLCSMSESEKQEYFADLHKKESKPTAVVRMTDWNTVDMNPRYRMGNQGAYSIDAHGFANNGIIY
jgi:hypothetical protein